jgi:hypothetical protein
MTAKDLDKYRPVIEEAVAASGRDDVGVGTIEAAGPGMLAVTFSRGQHSHTAHLPTDDLETHGKAHAAILSALLALTKRIAQEDLAKAAQ